MRKFNLLTTAITTMMTTTVFGQNTFDKWYIGIGAHATDHTSVRGMFDGYFDVNDYSFVPPLSKLTIARNIAKNLAVDLQLSIGSSDNKRLKIKDEFFLLAGLGLRYSPLSESNTLKWIDPYVRVGANYHKYSYDDINVDKNNPYISYDNDYNPKKDHLLRGKFSGNDNNFVINGGIGVNFWITKNLGLNLESQYNWITNYSKDYADFFQHSASVIFKFGTNDKDRDGIPDKEDRCPDTPGLAEFRGCPDTDGDGVPDIEDNCLNEPGPKENNGCPWEDTDGDGIPDREDRCPDTPGLAEFRGCPDTDGDGIPDIEDKCPDEPGAKSNQGCPVLETITIILKDINFKFNSAEITEDSQHTINKIIELLKNNDIIINGAYVDGHTDRVGSDLYNFTLSKKRAESVLDALIKAGIDKSELTARGFGKSQPKCAQADINTKKDKNENILYPTQADCDYVNRRVEILPKDKESKVPLEVKNTTP